MRALFRQLRTLSRKLCTVGFSLIRQSSPVPIVCFPAIEQASSDAFNGQNRTKSFDRVPFTLASRNSPDFALNLSAAGLHIKDDLSDVADNSICWAQWPEKLSQLNLNFVTAVWVLSYEILLQQSQTIKEFHHA